ncbi:homoprotocatechuate degradation operon regulator HpaR [Jiella pelagia]
MRKASDAPHVPTSPARTSRGRLRDFSRSLPMSLLRAREAVMSHFRPGLRHFDLTEQQWRVLRALTTVESIGTMNLASATFLLPPSLSRIVRDLEARGLIERSSVAEDLRRGMVAISPTGRDLVERAGQHSEAIYAEITRRFGAERLQLLQSMLKELEDVLDDPIEV